MEERENGSDARSGGGGRRVAIVDGSNVAHSTEGDAARLRNIRRICEKLEEEGFDPVVVVDAPLRHQIDEDDAYEDMVRDGKINQAPAGTDADYFILSFARELDAHVVSNDRFREYRQGFQPELDRLIRYMIVSDEVVLEKRGKGRSR
jgi:hypothetical protein